MRKIWNKARSKYKGSVGMLDELTQSGGKLRYALTLLLAIVCTQLPLIAAQVDPHDPGPTARTTHGTVNVFIGNENGLVVVTDSRLSTDRGFLDKGQKLFKVDDHTICTIAGWYSDPGPKVGPVGDVPSYPAEMSIPVLMSDFRLRAGSASTLEQKMAILSVVFHSSLRAVAAVDARAGVRPNTSPSQITLAGVAADGSIEILQKDFIPSALHGTVMEYEEVDHPTMRLTRGARLVYVVRGIPDTANAILSGTHELDSTDPILRFLTESLQKDGGKSLSLEDMEQIAKQIERVTAQEHSLHVGGPQQIAEISSGHVSSFVEPITVPTGFPKQMGLELADGIITGGNLVKAEFPLISIVHNYTSINSTPRLDNLFIFDSFFKHCHLIYGGSGTTIFDKSNKLVDTTLSVERASDMNSPFIRQLLADFPDLRIVPMPSDTSASK